MSNETLILKSAVASNSDIAITDLPFANVDALEGAKHFQSESFEGVKTFKSAKTGATAFGTATVKGDEVPIVIGSSEIYDEQFKYGVYADGQIKTADEIFAPNQDGNYDISDYPAVPATTLLDRLRIFPTGSNNTIRINKDTAAKYVEGFKTENLLNKEYDNATVNGDVNVTYNNGVFSFNGTATLKGDGTNSFYKKFFTLPAGTYNYRIHWLSEIIPNRLDVAVQITNEDNKVIVSITNEGNKTFTLTENTNVYIGVSLLELQDYDISFQIILSKNNVETNFIHPIEKLDYVVAQANAKGYDITIANNESDIKLVEKVEFDGTKYIDTGIDINGARVSEITAEVDTVITNFDNSMGLLSATTVDSMNSVCLFLTKSSDGNYYLISSAKAIKRTYVPQITIQDMLNKRNLYGLKNLFLTFNGKDDNNTFPNYTIDADNSTKIGCRHTISNNRNSLYGNVFSVTLNDNLFVPAYNNSANGMINLKDMSFHPLISFN